MGISQPHLPSLPNLGLLLPLLPAEFMHVSALLHAQTRMEKQICNPVTRLATAAAILLPSDLTPTSPPMQLSISIENSNDCARLEFTKISSRKVCSLHPSCQVDARVAGGICTALGKDAVSLPGCDAVVWCVLSRMGVGCPRRSCGEIVTG